MCIRRGNIVVHATPVSEVAWVVIGETDVRFYICFDELICAVLDYLFSSQKMMYTDCQARVCFPVSDLLEPLNYFLHFLDYTIWC